MRGLWTHWVQAWESMMRSKTIPWKKLLMLLGIALALFVLIKYLRRPKQKHTAGYLIRDVHVLVGDGIC